MTRVELYERFGPHLLEAIVSIMLSEINIVRTQAGLPERTREQLLSAITSEMAATDVPEVPV